MTQHEAYEARGFLSREDYLYWLAITYGLPVKRVTNSARSLGEAEDFEQLPVVLDKILTIEQGLRAAKVRTKHKKKAARRTRKKKKLCSRNTTMKGETP
jgi:hypothetical protein